VYPASHPDRKALAGELIDQGQSGSVMKG
jgi:hypothetical protein